jgi:Ankyrin repeats (3 copies)
MEQQLIDAARHGRTDDIRLLLEQGVNLNYRDGSRKTALIWASKYGHLETVQLLLSKSSNVSSVSYSSDSGWSPLVCAVATRGHLLCVCKPNANLFLSSSHHINMILPWCSIMQLAMGMFLSPFS